MKTTFLFLAIFFCCGAVSFAQIVNIPDAAFKAALVGNTSINTNGDGEIQISEAWTYTDTIDVNNLGISDLTGIEAFVGIAKLDCSWNQLDSLDISNNLALQYLNCFYCNLSYLDISNNTVLKWLNFDFNKLTSLNTSNNIELEYLYFLGNDLNYLDISNNILLKKLNCGSNLITSLDVSNNVNLIMLSCQDNQLTNLDVSNNIALKNLNISYNQLNFLNTYNNINLLSLATDYNQLNQLDISNNITLITFTCSNNLLTSLDISHNSLLQYFFTTNNPNLSCIQVWDTIYANNHWRTNSLCIDPQMYFSLDCNYTSTAENISSYFTLSPNPANNYLYIDSKGEKNVSYTISDIWGRSLEVWQDKKEVPINHLPAGVYFLTAQVGDKIVVKKFVKE